MEGVDDLLRAAGKLLAAGHLSQEEYDVVVERIEEANALPPPAGEPTILATELPAPAASTSRRRLPLVLAASAVAVVAVAVIAIATLTGSDSPGAGSDISQSEWTDLFESGSVDLAEVVVSDEEAVDGPCYAVLVFEKTPESSRSFTLTAIFRDSTATDLVTGDVLDELNADKRDCWRD